MENFKEAIQKFQSQEREKIREEFRGKLDTLQQKVKNLTEKNAKLERMWQKVGEAVNIFLTDYSESYNEKKSDSPNLRRSLRNKHLPPKEDLVNFQSIKDRIRNMKYDPQNFTHQLSSIGKKMAEYYRQSHNNEDPSKRDEKINDKHTLPVCVYAEEDWEYMDYLIKNSLNLE